MGIDQTVVRGKYTSLRVSAAAATGVQATEPADIVLTAPTGASVGDTTVDLTVPSGTAELKKNQILEFSGGAIVVVTADVSVGTTATATAIDDPDGETGDGIDTAIAGAETATWDGLYEVLGTDDSQFQIGENVQELNPASYQDAYGGTAWSEDEEQSKNWQISRGGRFKIDDYAYQQIRLAGLEGREMWVKRVLADEANAEAEATEGRAKVRGFTTTAPAAGIVDASWTFRGQGSPAVTALP